jgi:hypothetical protein
LANDAVSRDRDRRLERGGRVGGLVVGHIAEREHADRLALKPVSLAIEPAFTLPL